VISWTLLFMILVVLGTVFLLRSSFVIVPSGELWVVEQLGRFSRVLRPGMHFMIPFYERVARDFSSIEEPIDLPEHECVTGEGSTVRVRGVLRYAVVDAERAAYQVSDPAFGLLQAAQGGLRGIIELRTSRELREDLDLVGLALSEHLREASRGWGITIGECTLEFREGVSRSA
jgi:regulator of protease activity HflC (stomatin/prohibitin superfamily)